MNDVREDALAINEGVQGTLPGVTLGLISDEALRLLKDHRVAFHAFGKMDCLLCRSLRRSILKGLR